MHKQTGLAPVPPVAVAESAAEPEPLKAAEAALAAEVSDLEALRGSVVDAAEVGAGLWLSYLFVLFYLLVAVGGVTHRDLFLASPVKLPFLDVDLPLVGFVRQSHDATGYGRWSFK